MPSSSHFTDLLNWAYFFLKFRPRTKEEVKKYLLKKIKKYHWSTGEIEQVIKELEEENLINDEEFTRWFVEQRSATKPKSQFALKRELFCYGVDKETIERYFLEHGIDEEKLAEKALRSHWDRFKNLPSKKRFEKAASFLLRRGFTFEIAKKIIKFFEKK